MHARLAQVAREDSIVVEIEAPAPSALQQLGHFGVGARGAEVAPAIDDVHLRVLATPFADSERSRVRPVRGFP